MSCCEVTSLPEGGDRSILGSDRVRHGGNTVRMPKQCTAKRNSGMGYWSKTQIARSKGPPLKGPAFPQSNDYSSLSLDNLSALIWSNFIWAALIIGAFFGPFFPIRNFGKITKNYTVVTAMFF